MLVVAKWPSHMHNPTATDYISWNQPAAQCNWQHQLMSWNSIQHHQATLNTLLQLVTSWCNLQHHMSSYKTHLQQVASSNSTGKHWLITTSSTVQLTTANDVIEQHEALHSDYKHFTTTCNILMQLAKSYHKIIIQQHQTMSADNNQQHNATVNSKWFHRTAAHHINQHPTSSCNILLKLATTHRTV